MACKTNDEGMNNDISSPNIIILLADDLGWGDLGCYGNPIIRTPNLDLLASSGIKFTQCHSAGAICSPSRAALLTGESPYRIGFFELQYEDVYLRNEEITIPELLKQKQYETFFAGKWHVAPFEKGMTPDTQGFDYYFASQFNSTSDDNSTKNPTNLVRNGQEVQETEGYYCDLIVNEAMSWLKNTRKANQPFFMEICFSEPHCPVTPPEEYAEKYESKEIDSLARTMGYGGLLRFYGRYGGYQTEPNFKLKKYYYGMVEQMDDAVGTLIQYLGSSGLMENTLIIFTSDNGPRRGANGHKSAGDLKGYKANIWEGGHRVPFIARWPGQIKAGIKNDAVISLTDIFATLCEIKDTHGISGGEDSYNILKQLKGEIIDIDDENPRIFHSSTGIFALRKGKWKYIEGVENDRNRVIRPDSSDFPGLLFDMSVDPCETNNVADDYPGIIKDMKEKPKVIKSQN